MTSALPAPDLSALVSQWSLQPVAILAVLTAGAWYLRGVRAVRANGRPWARRRTVTFLIGLATFGWATNGFLQAYASSLFWVWTTQTIALLLAVPVILMAGQPVELSRELYGSRSIGVRFLDSGPGRAMASPLVGPALVPVLSAALFFGPVPGWSIGIAPVGWLLAPVVALIGSMIMLPLVTSADDRGSLAVGLAMAIGFFELLMDAIPGIVLRLQTSLTSTFFDYRHLHGWTPAALSDQQRGGGILWCVAELLDLPFLLLVFSRWVRADAREAAAIDTVLEAERIARGPAASPGSAVSAASPGADAVVAPVADQPWWITDREMQQRMNRR